MERNALIVAIGLRLIRQATQGGGLDGAAGRRMQANLLSRPVRFSSRFKMPGLPIASHFPGRKELAELYLDIKSMAAGAGANGGLDDTQVLRCGQLAESRMIQAGLQAFRKLSLSHATSDGILATPFMLTSRGISLSLRPESSQVSIVDCIALDPRITGAEAVAGVTAIVSSGEAAQLLIPRSWSAASLAALVCCHCSRAAGKSLAAGMVVEQQRATTTTSTETGEPEAFDVTRAQSTVRWQHVPEAIACGQLLLAALCSRLEPFLRERSMGARAGNSVESAAGGGEAQESAGGESITDQGTSGVCKEQAPGEDLSDPLEESSSRPSPASPESVVQAIRSVVATFRGSRDTRSAWEQAERAFGGGADGRRVLLRGLLGLSVT